MLSGLPRRWRCMLRVENSPGSYGMINAVSGVNFEVNQGEIVSWLGPTGAGKSTSCGLSTVLEILSASGTDLWEPEHYQNQRRKIVQLGISHVTSSKRPVCPQNLEMGAFLRRTRQYPKADIQAVLWPLPSLGRASEMQTLPPYRVRELDALWARPVSKHKLLLLNGKGLAPIFIEIFNIIQLAEFQAQGTTVTLDWTKMPRWPCPLPVGVTSWKPVKDPKAPRKRRRQKYLGG